MTLPPILTLFALRAFDFLLWATALIYFPGGFRIDGRLKFSYIHDLWLAIAIVYIIGRLTLPEFAFRKTSFGRATAQALDALISACATRTLQPFKNMQGAAYLILALMVWSGLLFFITPLLSYHALGTYVFDWGVIENAIYNISRSGRAVTSFLGDDPEGKPFPYFPNNRLNFGLFLFGAIYRFAPFSEILLFAQSLFLFTGVIPLYLLAKRVLPASIPAWITVFLYFFWDPIFRMNLWDVHETPFMIPLGLWAFYFIEIKAVKKALFFTFLYALWREDGWMGAAGIAFYAGLRWKRPVLGTLAACVGVGVFLFHVGFLNKVNSVAERYPYLGPNLKSAFQTIVADPFILFEKGTQNWAFWLRFFRSFGGLVLFSGLAFFPGLFNLLELGLAEHVGMVSWVNHYVGLLAAPYMAASIYGLKWLADRGLTKWFGIPIAIALTQLAYSGPGAFQMALNRYRDTRCIADLIRDVPQDVPVIAENPVASYLAKREWIMRPSPGQNQSQAQWLITNERDRVKDTGHTREQKKNPNRESVWEIVKDTGEVEKGGTCGGWLLARRRATVF